jgi:hypothetical protein
MNALELALVNPEFVMVKDQLIQAYRDQIHITSARDTAIYKYRSVAYQVWMAFNKYAGALKNKAVSLNQYAYMTFATIASDVWEVLFRYNPTAPNWNLPVGSITGFPDYAMLFSKEWLTGYEGNAGTYLAVKNQGYTEYPTLQFKALYDANNFPWNLAYAVDWCSDALFNMFSESFATNMLKEGLSGYRGLGDSTVDSSVTPLQRQVCDFSIAQWQEICLPAIALLKAEHFKIIDFNARLFSSQLNIDVLEAQAKSILDLMNLNVADVLKSLHDQAEHEDITSAAPAPAVVATPIPKKSMNPLWIAAAAAVGAFVLKGKS